jgi:hypothetical protein
MIRKLINRIRSWFDWSDLFENHYDWTQEPYEGDWWNESMKELYSRND